jgi:hypothetical protein
MRRVRSFFRLGAAIAVAVLMAATPGWAQNQDCQDLRAIWIGSITFVGGEAHCAKPSPSRQPGQAVAKPSA